MQQTTGTKHQIVIHRKISKVARGLKPASWIKRNYGLMKNTWKNTDTTKFIKDLRNEWDQKAASY